MSRLFVSLLAVLSVTCSSKHEPVQVAVSSTLDSIPQQVDDRKFVDSIFSIDTVINTNSSLYIGEVGNFPETGELYTSLYFRDNVNTDGLFESLMKQTDSLVYEDVGCRRERLPAMLAKNYFNFSGLDSISVYRRGELICKAKFARVELFSDLIEGQFIAVFRPSGLPIVQDGLDYYCISQGPNPYDKVDVSYEAIEDEELTKDVLTTIAADSQRIWRALHMRIMPYDFVYSVISMEARLLLLETNNNGQSRILKDLNEGWFISDMVPLHLESNGKPILLLRMGISETDMMWNSLVVFSGEEYEFVEGNRLSITDVTTAEQVMTPEN